MYLVLSGTFAFVARPERPSKSPRANVAQHHSYLYLLELTEVLLFLVFRGCQDAFKILEKSFDAPAQEMWPYQLFSHKSPLPYYRESVPFVFLQGSLKSVNGLAVVFFFWFLELGCFDIMNHDLPCGFPSKHSPVS